MELRLRIGGDINRIKHTIIHHELQLWELVTIEENLKNHLSKLQEEIRLIANRAIERLSSDEQDKCKQIFSDIEQLMTDYKIKIWNCIEYNTELDNRLEVLKMKYSSNGERENGNLIKTENQNVSQLNEMDFPDASQFLENVTVAEIGQEIYESSIENLLTSIESTVERPLNQCKYCDDLFDNKTEFTSHMRSHTEVDRKKYPCELCDRSYQGKYELKKHMRNHTGEQPYSCAKCGEKFSFTRQLRAHNKKHLQMKFNDKHCTIAELIVSKSNRDAEAIKCESAQDESTEIAETVQRFECEMCQRSYEQKRDLILHMRHHTGEKPISCKFCDETFSFNRQLRAHTKKHLLNGDRIEKTDQIYKCRFCGKELPSIYFLRGHIKAEHDNAIPFQCEHCERFFNKFSHYQFHVKIHTGENLEECDICLKKFSSKKYLRKHKENVHLKLRKYQCDICKKKYSDPIYLKRHMNIVHLGVEVKRDFLCNQCGKGFEHKRTLEEHLQGHVGEKLFACNICNKKFMNDRNLKCHIELHDDREFPCPQCPKVMKTSTAFRKHLAQVHVKEKRHKCQMCDMKFVDAHLLKRHLLQHTGERPFQCKQCNECYRTPSALRWHAIGAHNLIGERPFKCEECDEGFYRKTQLNVHMIEHTGIRPFPCGECESRFKTAGQLKTHILSMHTDERPFKCDQCGDDFKMLAALQRHMRSHTGEKPFACEICNARFADSNYLNVHARLHTGEKPFACTVCDRRFIDSRNMKKHMKIHKK